MDHQHDGNMEHGQQRDNGHTSWEAEHASYAGTGADSRYEPAEGDQAATDHRVNQRRRRRRAKERMQRAG